MLKNSHGPPASLSSSAQRNSHSPPPTPLRRPTATAARTRSSSRSKPSLSPIPALYTSAPPRVPRRGARGDLRRASKGRPGVAPCAPHSAARAREEPILLISPRTSTRARALALSLRARVVLRPGALHPLSLGARSRSALSEQQSPALTLGAPTRLLRTCWRRPAVTRPGVVSRERGAASSSIARCTARLEGLVAANVSSTPLLSSPPA